MTRVLRSWTLAAVGIGLLLLLWLLVSVIAGPLRAPGPSAVISQLANGWENVPAVSYISFVDIGYKSAAVQTVVATWVATGAGAGLGFAVGVFMGESRAFAIATRPLLITALAVPVLVAMPFFQMWFGASQMVGVSLVALYSGVTVVVITRAAVESINRDLTNYSLAMGATRSQKVRTVTLRAVLPDTFAAVRVAMAGGWGFMCLAEVMTATPGMGRLISLLGRLSNMAGMIAGVLVLVVVAVATDALLQAAGRTVNRWQE